MKKSLLFVFAALSIAFFACDKVDNPFPKAINTDLDSTIYPGNWSDYILNEWPDFTLLPDEDPYRNALIEDFTGHNCSACPASA